MSPTPHRPNPNKNPYPPSPQLQVLSPPSHPTPRVIVTHPTPPHPYPASRGTCSSCSNRWSTCIGTASSTVTSRYSSPHSTDVTPPCHPLFSYISHRIRLSQDGDKNPHSPDVTTPPIAPPFPYISRILLSSPAREYSHLGR